MATFLSLKSPLIINKNMKCFRNLCKNIFSHFLTKLTGTGSGNNKNFTDSNYVPMDTSYRLMENKKGA